LLRGVAAGADEGLHAKGGAVVAADGRLRQCKQQGLE
jgi:hypothetical protein